MYSELSNELHLTFLYDRSVHRPQETQAVEVFSEEVALWKQPKAWYYPNDPLDAACSWKACACSVVGAGLWMKSLVLRQLQTMPHDRMVEYPE